MPQCTMLHVMHNTIVSGNNTIVRAMDELGKRLPGNWRARVESRPIMGDRRVDALVEIHGPDGARGTLVVEKKSRVEPKDVSKIADQLDVYGRSDDEEATVPVVVAPFLSARTRERLAERGVGYVDLTGNIRVALDLPALFVQASGAERDPRRKERPARTLKGAKAGRVVRALCDFVPPIGVRELARKSGVDPGYVSRVFTLLEKEALIQRESREPVTDTDWQALIRCWTEDYSLLNSNLTATYLEPRGLNSLLRKLRNSDLRYAATGSLGAVSVSPVAPARLVVLFVDNMEDAAERLDLRLAEAGANVILAEPFDTVVYERGWEREGISYVALSQNAADLLTSPGRGPSEAEELMNWMERNQDSWRP